MGKKTLILTKEQLDEISGGNFSYLDNLDKLDTGNIYANKVSAEGSTSDGDTDKITTDDYASDMTRDAWPRDSRSYGKNGNYIPQNLYEMSKKEWEEKNITNEAKEHGNKRLNNRKFYGKSYGAVKQGEYRQRKAAEKAINGENGQEKIEGIKSLSRMQTPENIKSQKLFKNAKTADKITQASKPAGTKIKSAPKTGKEGAHSPETGYITPLR